MSMNSDMAALFGDEYQSLRESVNGLAQKRLHHLLMMLMKTHVTHKKQQMLCKQLA